MAQVALPAVQPLAGSTDPFASSGAAAVGPWTKYQAAKPAEVPSGPWDKYRRAKTGDTGPFKLTGKVEPRGTGNTPSTNLEMDGKPVYRSGGVENFAAGANDFLMKEVYGGLVDRSRNVINWAIIGANAATDAMFPPEKGPSDAVAGEAPKPDLLRNTISDENVGGSKWWTNQFEKIGVTDPDKVLATTLAERVARAAGEAAAATLVPEMVVGTLSKAGVTGPKAQQLLGSFLGEAKTATGMAKNAAAGAAAGAGAQMGMEAAPDELDPLAATVGGLAGGLSGAVAVEAPAMVRAAGRAAGDYMAPITKGGQERVAGLTLRDASSSPGAVIDELGKGDGQLVNGSRPTAAQASGDAGLGALERSIGGKREGFAARAEEQDAARLKALEGVQPGGSPEAVSLAVRKMLSEIQAQGDEAATTAAGHARSANEALGEGKAPDVAGADLRTALSGARTKAKGQESALWKAVDPDGNLALPVRNGREEAKAMLGEVSSTAKPLDGEEAAVIRLASELNGVVKFSDLRALQTRITTAMREERFARGESPAYARLARLNSAIRRDLETAVVGKAVREAAEVRAGRVDASETMLGRLKGEGGAYTPKAGNTIFTPTGRRLDVEYRVVDADELTPSNLDDMQPNPAFPSELQPRNRTRAASELQVSRIASELQPERLGASADASTGAPIIGPDGMVESGNARVLAIRKAYRQGGKSAADYRAFLESQGYSTAGKKSPVLVRVRKTDLSQADRVRFAQEANAGTGLAMSASERAGSDASRLDAETLALYRGGDIGSAENRNFVRSFLAKVADSGEEGAFATRDGALSLDGQRRVEGALLSSAYDDAALVEGLLDAGDENIRAFGRALSDVAGEVARVRAEIAAGRIDAAADPSLAMVSAARIVQGARRRGVSLPNALAQSDAFSRVSADAEAVLRIAYGNDFAGRLSRERFDAIMRDAISEAERQTTDARLFGDAAGFSEILNSAGARYGRQGRTSGEFSAVPEGAGALDGKGRDEGGRFVSGEARADGTGTGGSRIVESPGLEANFDEAALNRLGAASRATRERAETFDNKTLGRMLKRASTTAPYDVPAAAVAQKVFFAGPKSFEAIQSYRNAVGDGEALDVLKAYAVDRLRKAAQREDGTLDAAKVAAWRRSHADALRAFPELDAAFASAGKASQTMGEVAVANREALTEAQTGAISKLLKVEDPEDVAKTVGAIFSRKDAITEMRRVAKVAAADPEARDGLRRSVVEYMLGRFVTRPGSGVGSLKGEQFADFIGSNRSVLEAAGFSADEIGTMESIAADLRRARPSGATLVSPKGNDVASLAHETKLSILGKLVVAGVASGGTGFVLGPVAGTATLIGSGLMNFLRQRGLRQVDDLIVEAMLDPALARKLMLKAKPRTSALPDVTFRQRAARTVLNAGNTLASAYDEKGKESGSALRSRGGLVSRGEQ